MKIKYLNCNGKHKLFSFHIHDYKTIEIDGKHYMLDGGLQDYIRSSIDGTIEEGEIKDLIIDIRNVFTWGKNYDENGNRLKLTEEETREWCKSEEGKEFKQMFLDDWTDYWKGKKLINKPTEFVLLKDLTSSHICGILSHFNNRTFRSIERFREIDEKNCTTIDKQWLIYHEIFTQELNYRINNKLI